MCSSNILGENNVLKEDYVMAAQLSRGFQILQNGVRFTDSDHYSANTLVDSDFQRETAPKGFTGTSIDDFLGTNRSGKLVNVYNDGVTLDYDELGIKKVIVPIK